MPNNLKIFYIYIFITVQRAILISLSTILASLLCLDVEGAYDKVAHKRLAHNLRKRRIPDYIINWVLDFLRDRETEVRVGDYSLESSRVYAGIPQGSPISPILFLFYSADLLEACENIRLRTSAGGFVDDINALTYGKSTEENCRNLAQVHAKCEQWAARHGSSFDFKKYKLIHFTRTPRRFNINASLVLNGKEVLPVDKVKVLGVILDPALKWNHHLKAIETRAIRQLSALKSIIGSI